MKRPMPEWGRHKREMRERMRLRRKPKQGGRVVKPLAFAGWRAKGISG